MDERAAAIEELYRSRYIAFRNGIATVTGSYETARDVVQEAFARAWRDRRDFRGDGSLEGWIWRIAFRIALDGHRNGTRSGPPAALEPALVEPERDPALAAALRRLPPRKRLFVFLRYFADLSYAQIADVCRVSEGTVAAALAQARTTLHEEMTTKGSPR